MERTVFNMIAKVTASIVMLLAVGSAGVFLTVGTTLTAERKTPQVTITKDGNVTNIQVTGKGSFSTIIGNILAMKKQDTVDYSEIEARIDDLPPPYLLLLADHACSVGDDKGYQYLVLALVRMRFDAALCLDKSARQGVRVTLMTIPARQCAAKGPNEWKSLVARIFNDLKSEGLLKRGNASPWWICSHGMQAIQAAIAERPLETDEWLVPESQWDAIGEKLIAEYGKSVAAD